MCGTVFVSLGDVELPGPRVVSFFCWGECPEPAFSRVHGVGGKQLGVLSDQYRGGQPQKYFTGGKHADIVGAALNFPVKTLHGNLLPG